MSNFCLPPDFSKKLLKAISDGTFSPGKYAEQVSTEARRAYLEPFVGTENVAGANTLLESKMLLKDWQRGMVTAVKKLTGLTEKTKTDLVSKIVKMDTLLSPTDEKAFYADITAQKLGAKVTVEQANKLAELANLTTEKLKSFDEANLSWSSDKARGEYGAARQLFQKYLDGLKAPTLPFKQLVGNKIAEVKANIKADPFKGTKQVTLDALQTIADNSVSLVGSVDNSFIGRQGLTTLQDHPSAWWPAAQQSFVDFAKTIGGKNMEDALWSSIYSEPLYITGEFTKAGIFPKFEEAYPTSLPERIPILGRVFSASKVAFDGSALRMRIGNYKILRDIAQSNKVVWDDAQIKDVGTYINSSTARGYQGEGNKLVNLVLWAPKMLVADWNVLTAHTGGTGLETAFVRKQAAYRLLKVIASTGMVMTIANAISPGSAETDSTSADFGKVKVGSTRFGFTGSKGALIVWASRMVANSSKSTTSGKTKRFGVGYKPTTRFSTTIDFISGKANPSARAIIDWAKGLNYNFEKPTVGSALYSATTPISIQNAINLQDNASADAVMGVILDAIGINSTTYKK